jgi:hypothetical protein
MLQILVSFNERLQTISFCKACLRPADFGNSDFLKIVSTSSFVIEKLNLNTENVILSVGTAG